MERVSANLFTVICRKGVAAIRSTFSCLGCSARGVCAWFLSFFWGCRRMICDDRHGKRAVEREEVVEEVGKWRSGTVIQTEGSAFLLNSSFLLSEIHCKWTFCIEIFYGVFLIFVFLCRFLYRLQFVHHLRLISELILKSRKSNRNGIVIIIDNTNMWR